LWPVGAAGLLGLSAAVAGTAAALPADRSAWLQDLPLRVGGLSFLVAGLLAWARAPSPRFGQLMVACGASVFAGDLRASEEAAVFALGFCLAYLHIGVVGQMFLSFPAAWPRRRAERATVVFAYCAAVGSQVARYAADHPGPPWFWGGPQPNTVAAQVGSLLAVMIVVLVAVLLARRVRRASPPARRELDVLWATVLVGGALGLSTALASAASAPLALLVLLSGGFAVVGALLPFAFLAGLLRLRLDRGRVADLVVDLHANPDPARLRDALARTLGDPALKLAYRLPDGGGWVDIAGRPTTPGGGRGGGAHLVPVERRGAELAVLACDPVLARQRRLLDSVVAAAGLAVDNAHLHARLQAQLQEVQASRLRLAQAAFGERRRIQRDLHDGAQQRLLTVLMTLDRARAHLAGTGLGDPAPAAAAAFVQQAYDQLDTALGDLRDLTQAIYPATLVDQGLAAALEPLAERAPLPVELRIQPARWAREVETTAYFVVLEALANVYRHAHATSAAVLVAAHGGRLAVEVSDDGVGGAATSRGTGLRNLRDRVTALGGDLALDSPPGAGTRVLARLPVLPR
jgi:signal transduction histidine kinase